MSWGVDKELIVHAQHLALLTIEVMVPGFCVDIRSAVQKLAEEMEMAVDELLRPSSSPLKAEEAKHQEEDFKGDGCHELILEFVELGPLSMPIFTKCNDFLTKC